MAYSRFGVAEDDASGRPEDLAVRREASGQAQVLHHFQASHGLGILECGPTIHGT
jgi:hypothetical protein